MGATRETALVRTRKNQNNAVEKFSMTTKTIKSKYEQFENKGKKYGGFAKNFYMGLALT